MKPDDISAGATRLAAECYDTLMSEVLIYDGWDEDAFRLRIARAIDEAVRAERGIIEALIIKANERLGNLETPLMRGDNLAITLCTHFDDGEPSDHDTGWSDAAINGYEEVTGAIQRHYLDAIRNRKQEG